MPKENRPADLDAALRKWNAIATASFPDLKDSLVEARCELDRLVQAMEERRVLSQAILSQGTPSAQQEAAVLELPEHLAAFHVELRTLAVQAHRTLRAGELISNLLSSLNGHEFRLTAVLVSEPEEPVTDAALVQELYARIAQLEETLKKRSAATLEVEPVVEPAPRSLQDELVRLRREVEELREESLELDEYGAPPFEARIRDEAFDDTGKRRPMGLILLKAGLISTEQLEKALSHQRSAWNRHLGSILVELGFVEEEAVARAIAAQTRVEFVHLSETPPLMDAVRMVSRKLAEHHTVIPLRTHLNELQVAMANPLDLVALEDLKLATGRPIQPLVATANDIETAIKRYYGALA